MSFKDHFSTRSDAYAEFRPTYPVALFNWLAKQCAGHDLAWDCATGSGQAAAGLAPFFKSVAATDASAEQIAHAGGPGNVTFRVAPAEASGLADHGADLITAAQAAHWFDLPAFYAEARRVAKAKGVLALWGYGRLVLPGDMDRILEQFYSATLGAYWPPERRLIDDAYRSLEFPFAEIAVPDFCIEVRWNLPRLLAYLSTWSAVKRHAAATGHDPLPALEAALARHWADPKNALALQWPVFMRAGRM